MKALIFEAKTGKVKYKSVNAKKLPKGYEKNITPNDGTVYMIKNGKINIAVDRAKWEEESGHRISSDLYQGGFLRFILKAMLSAVIFIITALVLNYIYFTIFDAPAPIIMVLACSSAFTYGISKLLHNKF